MRHEVVTGCIVLPADLEYFISQISRVAIGVYLATVFPSSRYGFFVKFTIQCVYEEVLVPRCLFADVCCHTIWGERDERRGFFPPLTHAVRI